MIVLPDKLKHRGGFQAICAPNGKLNKDFASLNDRSQKPGWIDVITFLRKPSPDKCHNARSQFALASHDHA